jgi:hypothetical protein
LPVEIRNTCLYIEKICEYNSNIEQSHSKYERMTFMATIKSYTLKDGTEKWEFFVSKGRSKATGMPISIHKRGFANKTAAVNAAAIVQGQLKSGEYLEKNPEKTTAW